MRVIVDNDFSGDPDDLFQLAHHVLSPSVKISAVNGSHLTPGDVLDPGPGTAAHAVEAVKALFEVMGLDPGDSVHQGADGALVDRRTPHDTPAARAITPRRLETTAGRSTSPAAVGSPTCQVRV